MDKYISLTFLASLIHIVMKKLRNNLSWASFNHVSEIIWNFLSKDLLKVLYNCSLSIAPDFLSVKRNNKNNNNKKLQVVNAWIEKKKKTNTNFDFPASCSKKKTVSCFSVFQTKSRYNNRKVYLKRTKSSETRCWIIDFLNNVVVPFPFCITYFYFLFINLYFRIQNNA